MTLYYLKEIGEIVTGATPKKGIDGAYGSKIPFLTPSDYNGARLTTATARGLSEIGITALQSRKLSPNSISVTSIGSDMGKTQFNPLPVVTNQQINSIHNIKDQFSPMYVYYKLLSMHDFLYHLGSGNGSTMPILNKTDFSNIQIEIPSKKTQEEIVSYLDPLDSMIELRTMINDNLANLISTAFENTYERASAESTLGEVSEVTNGYAFKSKDLVSVPSDTTKAVFKMGNIQAGGGISHPSTKSWVEPPYFPKEKFLAREGDILMSMTDMKDNVRILGHTALMDRDKQYYVNQRVGILRATRLPAEYLYPLTNSKNFIQNLRMKANRGVQVNLTTKAIKESIVKVPDAKSLDDYLAIVNPLFDLQKLNSLEIDNLVEIRNEILNRMVH